MNVRKRMVVAVLALAGSLLTLGLVLAAEEWHAPVEASKVKNPVPSTKESVARGRTLYLRHCMKCHGISGKGNGPEAAGMDPAPGDFTVGDKMKAESDGELFWKITKGKDRMKPYAELSPAGAEQDRWDLVNFIRTLAARDKINEDAGKGNKSGKDTP